jgi:hypothetical protein
LRAILQRRYQSHEAAFHEPDRLDGGIRPNKGSAQGQRE